MPERFEVRQQEADQRLDKLLRQHFPELSFGQTQKLIRSGRVRVNGRRSKAADRVSMGAVVTLPFQGEPTAPSRGAGNQINALKIYEDESFIALNKPAGLAVQGGSTVTTHVAGMLEGTELRLVHRLDRETSGLLLLGKGALMAKHLTRGFADHAVEKSYLAVVGEVPQDQGTLSMPLRKVLIGGEGRMAIATPEDEQAQDAVTDFEILGGSAGAILLRLSPRTGRTHQLRVHSAHMFGGIFGDAKYGDATARSKGLLLHAWRARFPHPETGEIVNLEAPVPVVFSEALKRLNLDLPQEWAPQ